jgi:vacuolar iron transporter family protein
MSGPKGHHVSSSSDASHRPRPFELRRWRQHLANEHAEAAIYRQLAQRGTGEERAILLEIADAEARHERHWLNLLGDQVGPPGRELTS